VTRGAATTIAAAQRSGTTVTVHVRVTGSATATPTGTISISEHGALQSEAALIATAPGVAEADVKINGIIGNLHTFVLFYSGDPNYVSGKQDVPLIDGRGRAVRH
jgi:hypothetical protein